VQKFQGEFPNEPSIQDVEKTVQQMKEVSALGLYEIGQFYERTSKPNASILYYTMAVNRYPDTEVATKCQERLKELQKNEETSGSAF